MPGDTTKTSLKANEEALSKLGRRVFDATVQKDLAQPTGERLEALIRNREEVKTELRQHLNDSDREIAELQVQQSTLQKSFLKRVFPSQASKDLDRKISEAKARKAAIESELSAAQTLLDDLQKEKIEPGKHGLDSDVVRLEEAIKIHQEYLKRVQALRKKSGFAGHFSSTKTNDREELKHQEMMAAKFGTEINKLSNKIHYREEVEKEVLKNEIQKRFMNAPWTCAIPVTPRSPVWSACGGENRVTRNAMGYQRPSGLRGAF